MNIMIGIIMPERNCDFHAESYRMLFDWSNLAMLSASPLKAFMTM
ncbi:MAG: hypothetical protein KPEEDBHJ_02705 [Anaerolineales bacterium]|nr:hypothetical protein [Anaerolineales bacterium]